MQHSSRYGDPASLTNEVSVVQMGRVERTYHHQDWRLTVTFFNDRAVSINYHANYPRHVVDSDIEAIFRAESAGGSWSKAGNGVWTNGAGWRATRNVVSTGVLVEDIHAVERMQEPKQKPPTPTF